MNEVQRAAARAALAAWAAPFLAQAGMFTKGAYEGFLSQHGDELVEAIGNAVVSSTAADREGGA